MIRQLVNGEVNACLPVQDRGLHYGDGVFETLLVKNKAIQYLHEHYQRLDMGCQRLQISPVSFDTIERECCQLLGDLENAVIKIIVTRGNAERGYQYRPGQQATRILILYALPDYPPQNWSAGIKARVCETRLASNPRLAGIKHLNRLEQVLARSEWRDPDIAEGIMLDNHGNVIEGTASNIFMVENGQLLTPELSDCGVAGILRQRILCCAQGLGIHTQQEIIPLNRLFRADEVFVSNSIIGVWPISTLAAVEFRVGPVTRKIMKTLEVLPVEI